MTEIYNINWIGMSDTAILKALGQFIRHHRIQQNKTQQQLATEAGINRSTLVEFEKGNRSNTLTFIQLLRVLGKLPLLKAFEVINQPSPLLLAKEQEVRYRAYSPRKKKNKPTSDW